jgi:hypothetical protein
MTLTPFGMFIFAIGLLLLIRASMVAMLAFVMAASLFGGSAAIALPALGGSTVPPANLALLFLLLRVLLPGTTKSTALGTAVLENGYLLAFGLYGSISAWLLPRMFAGAIEVTPLRPGAVRQLYEQAPLHFSAQNVTTSVYLLGTMAAGLGSYVGAMRPGSARLLAYTGIAVALFHATFGFLSIAVADTPLNILIETFRTGHYAQLDQSIAGLSRMTGVWPEASGYAAYGGAWLIFTTELWLRDFRPRLSGLAALLLTLALLISTSSTAYAVLAGYALVLMARALLLPTSIAVGKLIWLAGLLLAAGALALVLMLALPSVLKSFARIVEIMTIEKTESWSGRQRLFWALQGIEAFAASYGLGIGAGSFRSSSLLTAILGSTGVIGILAFLAHLLRAFKPLERATWFTGEDHETQAVGVAASWTALLMLMPAAIASPTPDPGIAWALFAGLAIGLRSPMRESRRARAAPRPADRSGAVLVPRAVP